MPSDLPSIRAGKTELTMTALLASSIASATAWTTWSPSRTQTLGDSPSSRLDSVNSPRPHRYIRRRPIRSASQPHASMTQVEARPNIRTIQLATVLEASKCRTTSGSAMVSVLPFSETSVLAMVTTVSASHA